MQEKHSTFALKTENWLSSKSNLLFYVLLGAYTLFSLLYFNVKPSIAGDDSSYIIRAINFIETNKFPTYQGPAYPLFLSLIIWIAGMNLIILKLTSTAFMIGFIFIFYRSFRGKVSYISLFYTMAILSTSHHFLFFASQTYSEAFFIVLQAILFYFVFKGMSSRPNIWIPDKIEITFLVCISLLCVALFLTRTVGFGAIVAIVVFYLLQKQFARVLYLSIFFAGILFLFYNGRYAGWGIPVKSGEQSSQLLQKNPYDKTEGREDFKGFLTRYKDNSNLYLSKHLMRIAGFRSEGNRNISPILTITLYLIFLIGLVYFARKNKALFFTSIYLAIMLGITFFSLQKTWDQYRLIIPFVPLALLVLSESLISPGKDKKLFFIDNLVLAAFLVSAGLTFNNGTKTIDITTLSKNLNGDKLYGYTPDWVNYLKMAEYCHNELDEKMFVACRKPNMARIYGKGKKFHGIYRIPSKNADELVQYLKERDISHVMMASLRKNPQRYTGQSINTIQRFLAVIVNQYPNSLEVVKKFGSQEPTYLFKINYAATEPDKTIIKNDTIQQSGN
ncbi:hypothetical protein [Saccharicrinis sp. 156]|uniref:hypothetical protein n=1 Tax=Saccharicrinis sp. 156 TaxID=3417574 RepID=UPI003D340685